MSKEFLSFSDAQIKLANLPVSASKEFVNKVQLLGIGAHPAPLAKYGNSELVVDDDVVLVSEKARMIMYFEIKNDGGMHTQKTVYMFQGYWTDGGRVNHAFSIFQIPNYLIDNNVSFQGYNTFDTQVAGHIIQITNKTLDQLWAGNYNYGNVLSDCTYRTIANIPYRARNYLWDLATVNKNPESGAYVFAVQTDSKLNYRGAAGIRVWYTTPEAYFIDKNGNHTALEITMDW